MVGVGRLVRYHPVNSNSNSEVSLRYLEKYRLTLVESAVPYEVTDKTQFVKLFLPPHQTRWLRCHVAMSPSTEYGIARRVFRGRFTG
jgi:hypothetical protein